MSSSTSRDALQLAKDLWQQVKGGSSTPDLERCQEIVSSLEKEISKAPAFKMDVFVKTVTAAQKTFRLQKRNCQSNAAVAERWQGLLRATERMASTLQKKQESGVDDDDDDEDTAAAAAAAAADGGNDAPKDDKSSSTGLPSSTAVYLARLTKQQKELYKNPPAMPPSPSVVVEEKFQSLPQRDQKTGELTFTVGDRSEATLAAVLKQFHPNRTPEEVLRGGGFGGTYFRSIISAVTNQQYTAKQAVTMTLPKDWIVGLDQKTVLSSQKYNQQVNKYKSKCGGSLGMWESSGWISDADPYGWFQWYCRFYQGRRCSDDKRQIGRWMGVCGPKGRFRSQLCNKIVAANTKFNDVKISPVIRQTLWHWGIEITEDVLAKHKKRVGSK
jgi:hypothetical protein